MIVRLNSLHVITVYKNTRSLSFAQLKSKTRSLVSEDIGFDKLKVEIWENLFPYDYSQHTRFV